MESLLNIRKDKLIIVDLEATCWEGYHAPKGQTNEVLEIGVCLLDMTTFEITQKQSLLVRPTESIISEFCTRLTTITQDLVDREGMAFSEACERLETEYDSSHRLWGAWGSFDYTLMSQQCKRRNVRYPFIKQYVNFKRVFQDTHGKRLGLKFALEAVELPQEGTAHRGHDDAYNIAALVSYMVQKHGAGFLRRHGW